MNGIDEYLLFSEQINDYLSAFMVANDISYRDYHFSHLWEFIQSKGVTIRGFYFSGIAQHRISGMLVQDSLETTLGYNQSLPEKRKNFTVSHEIIHYLYHLDSENSIFTDDQKSLHYSYNDQLYEFQANIGASAILIPDVVLYRFLKEGYNFSQLSVQFGISENALYVRLIQEIQAHFQVPFLSAKKKADAIRYNFHRNGKSSVTELGTNLEKRLITCNRFIDAL